MHRLFKEIIMNQTEINEVLRLHKLWLDNDPEGKQADLSAADLSGADLQGADLQDADLQDADLQDADLPGADLRWADLQGADLSGADLRGADLRWADLQDADLQDADLQDADLRWADLSGAKHISELVSGMALIATPEIKTGWKKLSGGLICKLEIPPEAERSNATSRKCRCEFADVLEIWDGDKPVQTARSRNDLAFIYEVGKRVSCDKWDSDRWNECSGGIHFFLTRVEAENYL